MSGHWRDGSDLGSIASNIAHDAYKHVKAHEQHLPEPLELSDLEAEVVSWFRRGNDLEDEIRHATITVSLKTVDGQMHEGYLLAMDKDMGCCVISKQIGHEPVIIMNTSIISITIRRVDSTRGLFK